MGGIGNTQDVPELMLPICICCDNDTVVTLRLNIAKSCFQSLSLALVKRMMQDRSIRCCLFKDTIT